MRALVTGIEGFTGRYQAAELDRAGYEVFGISYEKPRHEIPFVQSVHVADLCDLKKLTDVVNKVQPDVVVHLAGISSVEHGNVDEIYRVNLMGARNLLEALSHNAHVPKAVLLASSSNIYGNASSGVLSEATPPAPANDYSVSKLAMEYMSRLYADRLQIVIARPFNYTGVGQSESFLLPKIIAHARAKKPIIELGNLDVARDFSDVRTTTNYYARLLECPDAIGKVFNVCSGRAYTLQDIVEMVQRVSGHQMEVRTNPDFARLNEVKKLLGCRDLLVAHVGEVPECDLQETLQWMYETVD